MRKETLIPSSLHPLDLFFLFNPLSLSTPLIPLLLASKETESRLMLLGTHGGDRSLKRKKQRPQQGELFLEERVSLWIKASCSWTPWSSRCWLHVLRVLEIIWHFFVLETWCWLHVGKSRVFLWLVVESPNWWEFWLCWENLSPMCSKRWCSCISS